MIVSAEIAPLLRAIAAAPQRFGAFPGLTLIGADADLQAQVAALAAGYDQPTTKDQSAERLKRLRAELKARNLDGFIVPMTDEHMGEYLPKRAQRLNWLTGFTGSAGVAVVLADKAAIWSDGRYTLQLRDQVDGALFSLHHLVEEPVHEWLARNAPKGAHIGYDPWLHTQDGIDRLRQGAKRAGAELMPAQPNPIDSVWTDQPPAPVAPVLLHDTYFAGETSAAKREAIAAHMREHGSDAAVLTLPESIAWLLNIRGSDVPRTPFPLSMAILHADASVDLFIDERKLGTGTREWLGNAVRLHNPSEFEPMLTGLGTGRKSVQIDPASAPVIVSERLAAGGANLVRADDPCLLPKAKKNPVELNGIRAAHQRDGVAMAQFLAWLATEAPKGKVDEIAAANRLEECRRHGQFIQDLSFDSISGAGPNGAIVHYRVSERTNRRLATGEFYLIDSGAQYLDGTTDITRTIAIGTPSPEMRDRFTRVLKGHIALATVLFPKGTSGQQLDILARHALWQAGLDYDHGTGHGVGAYLSVHEGPHRIAKTGSAVPLEPGMIVSNEPGYYKTGAYGIRIENLVAVREAEAPLGAERKLYGFETLTRAPIDRNAIDISLMTSAERDWLNGYHAEVLAEIGPLVDDPTRIWLEGATASI